MLLPCSGKLIFHGAREKAHFKIATDQPSAICTMESKTFPVVEPQDIFLN